MKLEPLSTYSHSKSHGFLFRHWQVLRTRAAALGRLRATRSEIEQLTALDYQVREDISLRPFETQERASITAFHPASVLVNTLMRVPCR
jgi:hypothetical protein